MLVKHSVGIYTVILLKEIFGNVLYSSPVDIITLSRIDGDLLPKVLFKVE